jgi:hypothetical protein
MYYICTGAAEEDYCVSTWNTFGKVAIDVDYRMPINVLRVLKVYFCVKSDITMQLWIPTGNRDEMELLWEYPIAAPADVPGVTTVGLITIFRCFGFYQVRFFNKI